MMKLWIHPLGGRPAAWISLLLTRMAGVGDGKGKGPPGQVERGGAASVLVCFSRRMYVHRSSDGITQGAGVTLTVHGIV